MSKISQRVFLVPALLAVAGFTAVAERAMTTDRAPQPVTCEISATPTSIGTRIAGVVHGPAGRSGGYQLALEKSGANGNSNVSQGGDFTIPRSGEATVSESVLNLSGGDAYQVAMTLSNGTRCEQRLHER